MLSDELKRTVDLHPVIVNRFMEIELESLRSGSISWGDQYSDPQWLSNKVGAKTAGYLGIPTNSNGSGQYLLSRYLRELGVHTVVVHSNTFDGVKQLYELSGLNTLEIDGGITGLDINTKNIPENTAVIIAPIGGGIEPDKLTQLMKDLQSQKVPTIIDAAHAAHLHLERLTYGFDNLIGIVYSFFVTKVDSVGEGGLITTANKDVWDFCVRFQMYDKPHYNMASINLRSTVSNSNKMMEMWSNEDIIKLTVGRRLTITGMYHLVCRELGVDHIWQPKMNGYKFIITDTRIKTLEDLSTTKVFESYGTHHLCAATFPHLVNHIDKLERKFNSILISQL